MSGRRKREGGSIAIRRRWVVLRVGGKGLRLQTEHQRFPDIGGPGFGAVPGESRVTKKNHRFDGSESNEGSGVSSIGPWFKGPAGGVAEKEQGFPNGDFTVRDCLGAEVPV